MPQESPSPTPTDPTGRSFLSYRHARMDEARLLVATQRELGIPTWQDVDDLDEEPMEARLRQVLHDPGTANAILWITPEVEGSDVIRKVEAPEIVRRHRDGDPFFLLPVAAGGLGWDQAAALVDPHLGALSLAQWKMREEVTADLTPEAATKVAERVLSRRLKAVHAVLPPGEPLRLRLFNRGEPAFEPGWALSVDWHRHFRGRRAEGDAWTEILLPRLQTIQRAITRSAPGRPLSWTGHCTNSAGLALGFTFLARGPMRCTWLQQAAERPSQEWSLAEAREEVPLEIGATPGDVAADDLAVLLSFTEDVEPAFGISKPDLPPFRATLRVEARRVDGDFQPLWFQRPGQVVGVLDRVVAAMRKLRRDYPGSPALHLFAAIPLGFAFLLGQSLNTLGPVQTYEVEEGDSVGRYRAEVRVGLGNET